MAKGRGQWLGATPGGEQVNELLHVVSEQNDLLSGYKVGPLINGSLFDSCSRVYQSRTYRQAKAKANEVNLSYVSALRHVK